MTRNRGKRRGGSAQKRAEEPAKGSANPLAALPPEQREQAIRAVILEHPELFQQPKVREAMAQVIVQQSAYQGPVPPAEMYAAYEKADPGSGRLLIDMTSRAMTAQVEHNSRRLNGDFAEARLGQIFAFVIAMTAILCGAYVAIHGAKWPGTIIGVGGLAAIVYQFIQGRKRS